MQPRQLPADIQIERQGGMMALPKATSPVLSIILNVLLRMTGNQSEGYSEARRDSEPILL
jgi:hypothetical protein